MANRVLETIDERIVKLFEKVGLRESEYSLLRTICLYHKGEHWNVIFK